MQLRGVVVPLDEFTEREGVRLTLLRVEILDRDPRAEPHAVARDIVFFHARELGEAQPQMRARAWANCCRSSAALYSEFSRRSPWARAFSISLGSTKLISWFRRSTSACSLSLSSASMGREI